MIKKIAIISVIMICITSCEDKKNINKQTAEKTQKEISVPQFNADSAYHYVVKQLSFGPRVPETEAHALCAEWFIDFFKQKADTVYVQDFRTRLFNGKGINGKNIIASFNPTAKKRILLAAHWDSRPYADYDPDEKNWNTPIDGANDGASGVGVLMEIARVLKDNPIGIGIDMILFDLEDYGAPQYMNLMTNDDWALGSQYWSKNPHIHNYRAYYGILLDMVGASNPRFPKEYYSHQFAPSVSDKIWNTAQKIGYSEYFVNEIGHPINDDHIYVNINAKIPMIDIIHLTDDNEDSSFYPYWHTLQDNLDQIDPKTLGIVGDVVLNVIYNN